MPKPKDTTDHEADLDDAHVGRPIALIGFGGFRGMNSLVRHSGASSYRLL